MARATYHRRRALLSTYRQGLKAARAGKPREACPYASGPVKTHWLAGWVDGRDA